MSSVASAGTRVRVVVADDAPEVQRFMELFLGRHEGIDVVGVVGSGPEALELVDDEEPDVLLLDLDMPGMDGFEVLRLLAGREDLRTRVVVVSGLDVTEVEERCLALGAARVLDKANGFEDLPDAVLEVGRDQA